MSVDAVPAVGWVYVGYVLNADVAPVTLSCGPAQPAPSVQPDAHAGQLAESPNDDAAPPKAAHAAVVMSTHELAPASEEEP